MTKDPKVKHLKEIAQMVERFTEDHRYNISLIVEYAGVHLNAISAFYNRIVGEKIITYAKWNAPDDYVDIDNARGHICSDVVSKRFFDCFVVRDLPNSVYYHTDPNVKKYNLESYMGCGVGGEGDAIGSLCVVYQEDHSPTEFENDILRILSTFVSIEEEKVSKDENVLKAMEFLDSLVDDSLDMIVAVDASKNIVRFNKAAKLKFGYGNEEIIKQNVSIIYVNENESDRVYQCLSDTGKFHGEVQNRTKDGKVFTSLLSASMLFSRHGDYIGTVGISRDVTEEIRTRRQLQKSEQRFRELADLLPTIIMEYDKQGNITYVNKAGLDLFERSQDEIDNKSINVLDVVMPLDVARAKKSMESILIDGETTERNEYIVRGPEGKVFTVLLSAAPIRACGNEIVGARASVTDITDIKEVQARLKDREARLDAIVNTATDAIIIIDSKGTVVFWNEAANSMFGYNSEEVIGKTLEFIMPKRFHGSHKEGLKKVVSFGKKDHCVIGNTVELSGLRRNGSEFPLELSLSRWGNNGGSFFTGIIRDITDKVKDREALKASEEKFRFLIENSPQLFWIVDMDLHYTYISPSCLEFIGYTQEEMYGTHAFDHFPDYEVKKMVKVLSKRLETKDYSPKSLIVTTYTKSKEIRWQELYISFLLEDGEPVGFQGVSRDITEKREMEFALSRRDSILQAVSFTADKFLNDIEWVKSIDDILERLGKAADVDRVYVFKKDVIGHDVRVSQVYEWCDKDCTPQLGNEDLQELRLCDAGFCRWENLLRRGEPVVGFIDEFPESEKKLLSTQSIKSILVMPLIIDNDWWGFIGFDDCTTKRVWTDTEIDALRIVTSTLSAGIKRDEERKKLEQLDKKRWEQAEQYVTMHMESSKVFNPTRESKKALFNALTLMKTNDELESVEE